MSDNTRNRKQNLTRPEPRRKLTLIGALVILAVGAVILRFLYHLVYWKDGLKAIVQLKPLELVIVTLFVAACYLVNKHNPKL